MKQELQKKLFEKYPKIFRQKDLSMKETCMCWGIDTGDGWYYLIDSLCGYLQGMTDNNPTHEDFGQIEAVQVKEKFGTLRFYTGSSSREQEGAIGFAEYLSAEICDVCGHRGKPRGESWITTRCDKHAYE